MAIKQMAAIRRKPGMTHAEFCEYVVSVHGELAKAKPSTLLSYIQNHVFDGAFGAETDKEYQQHFGRDMIIELAFASKEDMQQNFADPYTQEVIRPDGKNFNDLPSAIPALVFEVPMEVVNQRNGNVKVIQYLKKSAEISTEDFYKAWEATHQLVVANNPAVTAGLCKYLQNHVIAQEGAGKHFGGGEMINYEGIACLWFEDEKDLKLFRDYQTQLFQSSAIFNPSKCFFVYTNEVVIIQN